MSYMGKQCPNVRTIEMSFLWNADSTETRVTSWRKGGQHCFVRKGVQFHPDSGHFRVTKDGLYQVYSHVTFQPSPGDLTSPVTFAQSVLLERETRGETRVLNTLRDAVLVPCSFRETLQGGVANPCHVSNIMAALYLRADDKLSVKLQPISYVKGDMKSTYFGFLRIAGWSLRPCNSHDTLRICCFKTATWPSATAAFTLTTWIAT